MINYELAKQLKEAGLKHNCSEDCYFNIAKEKPICCNWHLEELIEACGDMFESLLKERINKRWICYSVDNKTGHTSDGKTPEIAVAKLWLKLNAKKNNK